MDDISCATRGLNPESSAHKTNALTNYASGATFTNVMIEVYETTLRDSVIIT
jgi:hypothetical protein